MEGAPSMRKISAVWDYLMRRKPLLVALIVAVTSAVLTCSHLNLTWPQAKTARLTETNPELAYNNSLYLVIYGQNQQPSYSLSFEAEFQRANVIVKNNPLAAEAYVRIFDEQGQLLVGEYTTMQDQAQPALPPDETIDQLSRDESGEALSQAQTEINQITYLLTEEDKHYTLPLKPGYLIELRTASGSFYSTLDWREAVNFRPAKAQSETYVVMKNGLRKTSWSEAEGKKQMYGLLRDYIVEIIEAYKANVTDEVLNNKNLDLANKSRVMLSYYLLEVADQAPYAEFMEHLRRGGSPVIQYIGPTEYELGAEIDLLRYLSVTDSEDGEIVLSRVQIRGEIDNYKVGTYTVEIIARDSDENETQKELEIQIIDLGTTDSTPEVPEPNEPDPPITVEPILPVRPPAIEPEKPLERPVVGIFDRPQQGVSSGQTIADTATKEPEDATSSNQPVAGPADATTPTPELPSTIFESPSTVTASVKKAVSFSDFALIVGGIIVFLGLMKFIFDHYVR